MYCMNCGTPNSSTAVFCASCGASVAAPVATKAAREERATPYASPLGAAWNDITSTPNWIKKAALLCLAGSMPVLNFAIEGFALRWGRDLAFDKREPLPKEIFRKKEILTGFRAFLIELVLVLAYAIASIAGITLVANLLASISLQLAAMALIILAVIAAVAFVFGYWPFVCASTMRMAVVDYLEAGFNVQKTWRAFKRAPGSAMSATILPALASGLIRALMLLALLGIAGAITQAAMNDYMSTINDYNGMAQYIYDPSGALEDAWRKATGLGNALIAIEILFWIAAGMIDMFCKMLTWRAFGYWTAQTAPEWAQECDTEAESSQSTENLASSAAKRSAIAPQPIQGNSRNTAHYASLNAEARPYSNWHASHAADDPENQTRIISVAASKTVRLVRMTTGKTYEIVDLPAVIGKGKASDIVVEQASTISRTHARFALQGTIVTVEDLNSTNGTFVNNIEIAAGKPTEIKNGDTVSFAGESFRVEIA